jgi:hypothetical protein
MSVKNLNNLGEVGQGASEAIDFVDDDDVDTALLDLSHKSLEGGSFYIAARESAVVVLSVDQLPPFMGLASNVGFTRFALRVE